MKIWTELISKDFQEKWEKAPRIHGHWEMPVKQDAKTKSPIHLKVTKMENISFDQGSRKGGKTIFKTELFTTNLEKHQMSINDKIKQWLRQFHFDTMKGLLILHTRGLQHKLKYKRVLNWLFYLCKIQKKRYWLVLLKIRIMVTLWGSWSWKGQKEDPAAVMIYQPLGIKLIIQILMILAIWECILYIPIEAFCYKMK